MKKLAFLFAAVVAVSFASCGNATQKGADADSCCADSEAVEVVEAVEDTCCSDTCSKDTTCCAQAPVAE